MALEDHLNYLDDFRLDTSADTVDVEVEGIRAINFILRDMEAAHYWDFTVKHQRFDYFNNIVVYPVNSNYREMIGLYEALNFLDPFRRVKPVIFRRLMNGYADRNLLAHEFVKGQRRLLVNFANTKSRSLTIATNNAYDGDGTWVGTGSAANVASDTTVYIENNGAVRFDKTTASDAIMTLANMATKDATVYGTDWGFFFKFLLPRLTAAMTLIIKVGIDASNYYQWTITTGFDGYTLAEGLNQIGVRKQDATVTGTVASDATLGYVQLTVQSTQTTIRAMRMSEMTIKSPDPMEFEYYSNDFVYDASAAAYVNEFDNTDADDDHGAWEQQYDFINNLINTGAAGLILKEMQEDARGSYYWKLYRGDDPNKVGGLLADAMKKMPTRVKKIDPPSLMLSASGGRPDYYANP